MIAILCVTFGGVALLLAAIGLYGVLFYNIARRTNEIGIRMALGAGRERVVLLILREVGVMMLIGLALGIILTGVGTRFIASRLCRSGLRLLAGPARGKSEPHKSIAL
jgi:ABC-type antimicrobial peptide transport system permease subunit